MSGIPAKIPVKKIEYKPDRKYGEAGDIALLAESIKAVGLINDITVRAAGEGAYELLSGRRRLEAAKLLGWETIPAKIIEGNPDGSEVSLAENINRLEMHPLDEAVKFRALLDSGVTIEDLAKRYDRSVSGIYQRTRLTRLADELKDWFRAGRITMSVAAALASLDDEKQKQFCQERKKSSSVSAYHLNEFLYRLQRCRLKAWFMDNKCGKCKNRTWNTDPELFEDYQAYEDVCFDEQCWKNHWVTFIGGKLQAVREENPDEKFEPLILVKTYSIPDFIKEIVDNGGVLTVSGEAFRIRDKYDFVEAGNPRRKGAFRAFRVSFGYNDLEAGSGVFVEKEDAEKKPKGIPIEDYLDEDPRNQTVKKILDKKYDTNWCFKEAVKGRVMELYLRREGESGKEPSDAIINRWFNDYHSVGKKDLQRLFRAYTGKKFSGYSKAFKEVSAAKMFFVLFAATIKSHEMPDKQQAEKPEEFSKTGFIKFSGLGREEYLALYQEAVEELVVEAAEGG